MNKAKNPELFQLLQAGFQIDLFTYEDSIRARIRNPDGEHVFAGPVHQKVPITGQGFQSCFTRLLRSTLKNFNESERQSR